MTSRNQKFQTRLPVSVVPQTSCYIHVYMPVIESAVATEHQCFSTSIGVHICHSEIFVKKGQIN
jgi:hypothetical protein